MNKIAPTYQDHRHPIDRGVPHSRFNLSLREVEEMLLERGIVVSYETVSRGAENTALTMRDAFTRSYCKHVTAPVCCRAERSRRRRSGRPSRRPAHAEDIFSSGWDLGPSRNNNNDFSL